MIVLEYSLEREVRSECADDMSIEFGDGIFANVPRTLSESDCTLVHRGMLEERKKPRNENSENPAIQDQIDLQLQDTPESDEH